MKMESSLYFPGATESMQLVIEEYRSPPTTTMMMPIVSDSIADQASAKKLLLKESQAQILLEAQSINQSFLKGAQGDYIYNPEALGQRVKKKNR
jgi:hypothetical protein